MSTARIKTVYIDGAEFVIASLTLEQVEEFIGADLDAMTDKDFRIRAYDLICTGLNNAKPAETWTHERVRKELDLATYELLQEEILSFSKLRRINLEETRGEKRATADATQPVS